MFKNRTDAGRQLLDKLLKFKDQNPLVLALPRGGVPVGFEVARALNTHLGVLVVRKLGVPGQKELGFGAIAPGGVRVIDERLVNSLGISEDQIKEVEEKEKEELERRIKYYGVRKDASFKGKTVILVDDGLATGISTRAAIKSILAGNPEKLVVAVPVAALEACEGIRSLVRPMKDEVICLDTLIELRAVGLWYKDFTQVSDEDVKRLLSNL